MSKTVTETVEQRVKRVVIERLNCKPEEVTPEARFTEELGADSLAITELTMALEEEFNIDLDDDVTTIETVGQAITYIRGKTGL